MRQGLEPEYLTQAGIKPWLTQEPGSNTVVDKRAFKLYFQPELAETVGYRNAKLNSDGVPTNINKSIPLGVSFKTDDGQVLFSRLKPQGGCPWCLDPEPHNNIRTKGGLPTPQCIPSAFTANTADAAASNSKISSITSMARNTTAQPVGWTRISMIPRSCPVKLPSQACSQK